MIVWRLSEFRYLNTFITDIHNFINYMTFLFSVREHEVWERLVGQHRGSRCAMHSPLTSSALLSGTSGSQRDGADPVARL